MKIFVTGSEGFVGQHLVDLLKKDHFVIGLSRQEKLEPKENIEYINGDILDSSLIPQILEKYRPEAIIHLAAIAVTWSKDYEQLFSINFMGTLNIFESVLKVKEKSDYDPKVIYVSTADVYGKTTSPENITEDAPFFPINHYAVSKVAADRLSYQYSQTKKLKVAIARPFNHAGPVQKKGFFVPDMASQIAGLEKSPDKNELFVGNLQSQKDFLDVRDVVKAYKALIESDFKSGEAYNISSGKAIKFEDLLNTLLKLSSKKITVKQDPERMRSSEIPLLVGNNTKFTNLTGWHPEYSIEQTLEDTLNYWRSLKE